MQCTSATILRTTRHRAEESWYSGDKHRGVRGGCGCGFGGGGDGGSRDSTGGMTKCIGGAAVATAITINREQTFACEWIGSGRVD